MQLLGSRIKNEIIEKRQLVRALLNNEDNKPSSYEPLPSMCVACGASTFEVWITMPKWAAQVIFVQSFSAYLCIELFSPFGGHTLLHFTPYV
jgi:hypothetical protein